MLLALLPALALLAGLCSSLPPAGAGSTTVGVVANTSLPLPQAAQAAQAAQAQIATLVENRLRLLSSRLSSLVEGSDGGNGAGSERGKEASREAALRGIWSILEDFLKAIFNAVRLLLDPAPLGSYDLSLNSSFIKGRLAAHHVLARHLRDIQFHVAVLNPFTMCTEVRVELPRLTLKTYYDADLVVDDGSGELMPIFGAGRAQIDLHNGKLASKVCLKIKEFSVQVTDMEISLEKAEVDLRGLFGGGAISDLISGIATDVLPGIVEEYQPEITQLVIKYINEFLRKILHGKG